METRSCEVCHVRMPPFVPRKRDDEGRQVCWGCHATPRGGYVSAEPKTASGLGDAMKPVIDHIQQEHGVSPDVAGMMMRETQGKTPDVPAAKAPSWSEDPEGLTQHVNNFVAWHDALHRLHRDTLHQGDYMRPPSDQGRGLRHVHGPEDDLTHPASYQGFNDPDTGEKRLYDKNAPWRDNEPVVTGHTGPYYQKHEQDGVRRLSPHRTDEFPNLLGEERPDWGDNLSDRGKCSHTYPLMEYQTGEKCQHCGVDKMYHAEYKPSEIGQNTPDENARRHQDYDWKVRETGPLKPLKPSLNALTTAVYGEEPMHVKQFTPGDDVYGDMLRGDSDVATNIDRHLHEHHDPEFADRVKRRVRHDLQLTPDEHMHYQDLDVAHQVMHEHERSLGQESHDHDEASNIPYPGDPEYGKHLSRKTAEKNPADHTMYGDGLNCSYCGESAGLHPHPHEGEWAPCSLCNKDMSHHLHDTGRWEHLETSKYQAPVDVKHIWDVYGEDYPKQGALRDQNECPHDGEWNLHGQCKQCGYTPPTEADEPCDDEWCVENEPEHTKGEHVDPPHRDPGHPDYHAAEQGVEDAIGEHPDGWLLDHQPEGPSKFSKIAHSGHTEPDVGPTSDLPGENHTTLHGHRDEKTILPGLGCPHCDGGFFHEDARENHIKENHPGQYAGPSEDMLMMKQMRDERQQEQEQKENGTYGGFPHITPGDHEALHHHLIEHHGDASYAEDFPFEEDDKYHKGKMQPFHDRAHSDLEDEKEHEGYGYGYHFHVDPHNEENGYRRHFDLPNYKPADAKYDLGPATDTHLMRAHGRDPEEVEPGWQNARWHQNIHEEPDNFPEDEHEEFNHKHGSVKEAMWAPIDKRVDDMEPGDVVISGGEFHPVSEVKFHAPGEHPQSPIHNHMHAVEVVTPHGSRWSGSGRTMSTFHPDLAGETAVPFRLRENEGFTHEGSQQMELFPELHEQQGHLKNPHDQSYDWHHGTPHEFKSFDDDPYEDSDWDELDTEREDKKHWNASLGQHWTALPHVADSFARGQYHNFGSGPGKVITANLGIKHPKVYDSEFQMDSDAFDQAWPKTGPVRDDHDPEMQHDAVCDRPGQCEGLHEHDNTDPIHAKMRKWYGSGAGNTGDRGTWLSSHPEKDMIASQFRHTLQEQGHDGIVYGNEIEAPHGHPCAVTFDTDQIHNVRESPAGNARTAGYEPYDSGKIGDRWDTYGDGPDLERYRAPAKGESQQDFRDRVYTEWSDENSDTRLRRQHNMPPNPEAASLGGEFVKRKPQRTCPICRAQPSGEFNSLQSSGIPHPSNPSGRGEEWRATDKACNSCYEAPFAAHVRGGTPGQSIQYDLKGQPVPMQWGAFPSTEEHRSLRPSLNSKTGSTDDNYNPKCQYCKLKVPHVRHHEDILHDIYGDAEHPKKTSNSSESAEGVHLHSCPSCNQFWNHTMAGTGKPCPFGPVETCRDCVDRQYNDSEANLVTPEQNFQHGEHWDGPNHNEPYPF